MAEGNNCTFEHVMGNKEAQSSGVEVEKIIIYSHGIRQRD